MNFLKSSLVILFVFSLFSALGQTNYVFDLKGEKWDIKPALFYISDLLDERSDKSNAGNVLSRNKSIPAKFKISAETDLKTMIDVSMEIDTSQIPLVLVLNRFKIKEIGTSKNRKLSLDFSIVFYRIINNKRYKVFESNGKPEMNIQGVYLNAAEKIIRESLKSSIKNFNDWINLHSDIPPLAGIVRVVFENENINNEKRDTLHWDKNYKLKWSDFKGNPEATSFMAQSNCIFSYRSEPKTSNGILNLQVRLNACFDRNGSWVKTGQQKDPLLAHEQLHFDICELNVRHLRKRILDSSLNPMEFDIEINTLFNKVWKEYLEQQKLYDEETGHGIIAEKQLYWEKEILNQLKNTSSYKD